MFFMLQCYALKLKPPIRYVSCLCCVVTSSRFMLHAFYCVLHVDELALRSSFLGPLFEHGCL